jgi:hypothetical protein
MNQSQKNNNLFLKALEDKNYYLVNNLIEKGLPDFTYNKESELEEKQFSIFINKLKFYLRELYLDGEFYIAKKLISKFSIKRNQTQGQTILTKEDLVTIGEYLIEKSSSNIYFFWNEYFKNESNKRYLLRFTLTAIEYKNSNFLSSYDNIKSNFQSSLLLKKAINNSFSHDFNEDFFINLFKFYFIYNPQFNFKKNIIYILKHQFLIRNIESISSEEFRTIEKIYYSYFPHLYSFKVAQGLFQSLKKRPENKNLFNEYINEIFQKYSLSVIKQHGTFLFKTNSILEEKFNLFNKLNNKLQNNLLENNHTKQKLLKI